MTSLPALTDAFIDDLMDGLSREMDREFPDWGVLVDPPPLPEWDFFRGWLDRGHHAGLEYLMRTASRRRSLNDGYPGYRSLIIAVLPYDPRSFSSEPIWDHAQLARYAVGEDYHDRFERTFHRIILALEKAFPSDEKPLIKPDHGALLEKSLAEKAGLGRMGKNTLLIHPKFGSWFTLGSLLLKTPLRERRGSGGSADPCGQCSRCLSACPTQAFDAPYDLKAGRCLSYLTIERPGDEGSDLRRSHGGSWLFGCDRCQEVCPHNGGMEASDLVSSETGRFVPLEEASEEGLRRLRKAHGALTRVSVSRLLERMTEIGKNRFPNLGEKTDISL